MKKEEVKEVKKSTQKDFKYDIEQLLRNCEAITGYKREVGEGALHDANVEKMTKKEFQDKVKGFLKKKVNEKKEAK